MSFVKAPNPWNSGYAIPKYVQAEPPERGVFVTQWLPRGTISQVIPDYLAVPKREVAPKGVRSGSSLSGSSLGGTCFDGSSLSGSSLGDDTLAAIGTPANPASFSAYGQKVARTVMAKVKGLPSDQRGKVLKKALSAIDKTLPARAEKYALAEQKAGAPASVALERGIARAVSEGAVTELAAIGRARRSSPQARSLRGLGRSHSALGADVATSKIGMLATSTSIVTQMATAITTPKPGECRLDANGKPAFIWVAATATVPGHWERLRAGQTCASTSTGPAPDVRVHESGEQLQPPPTVGDPTAGNYRAVQVGPFKFPADQKRARVTFWGNKLPADWQAFIKRVATVRDVRDGHPGVAWTWNGMDRFIDGLQGWQDAQYVGGPGREDGKPSWKPVARATHPDTGKEYGVFINTYVPEADKNKPLNEARWLMDVIWSEIDKSWYEDIWDWIQKLVGKIVDVIGDVVDAVKDATCDLLSQPGVDQAAISAAAATPSPQTAGVAAGVVIGQKLCGGQQVPQLPQTPVQTGMNWLVPVGIGAGVLLIYALTR